MNTREKRQAGAFRLTALVSVALLTATLATAAVPTDSLFHVNPKLETADGRVTNFASTGQRVQIVTMFYSSCPMACPLIIDTLKHLDAALTPERRQRLGMLLISVDPEHDSPTTLKALAAERRIADPRWILARTTSPDTRKLAAALGIQYRALGNGDFDHSSTMVLLDPQGRVLARSTKLGVPDPEFLTAIRKAVDAHMPRAAGNEER